MHGGHSGAYCDHAVGTLREVLDAAVAVGMTAYGISEHAPRGHDRFLYDQERALGWDNAHVEALFAQYTNDVFALADEYSDRLRVWCGFEAEVVPKNEWIARMRAHRAAAPFAFVVGSVHYVDELSVDGPMDGFLQLVEHVGGLEALAIRYYDQVAEMVLALQPEIVGHLDLVRRNGEALGFVETTRSLAAAERALQAIQQTGAVLDLNTAGWRKGLSGPYPGPTLAQLAHRMGIGFTFGDDSHGPADVGAGIDDARQYLLDLGVGHVSVFAMRDGRLVPEPVALG